MNDEDEMTTDDRPELDAQEGETEDRDALLAAREAEIAELSDRLLRVAAETENVRRRLERDKADASVYAVTAFARDMLAVADNLRRALDAAEKDEVVNKGLLTGVEMTEKELQAVFAKHGISRIDSVGERLDPNRHQAMLEVEETDAEPGTVVREFQSGYLIKDRLLRPAMVGVAKRQDPES